MCTLRFLVVVFVLHRRNVIGLADMCKVEGDVLNCSAIHLTIIPRDLTIPSGVYTIDFSYNTITNISVLDFRNAAYRNITTLLLHHNSISLIEYFSFAQLQNIESLDLSHNKLQGSVISGYLFTNLSTIQALFLNHNPIKVIEPQAFTLLQMPALQRINLSHCEIDSIGSAAFDFSNLTYLDLSWNNIPHTFPDSFYIDGYFGTWDLSHNNLTKIDKLPIFQDLRNIILDYNYINRLTLLYVLPLFANPLKTVSVRYNRLTSLTNSSLPQDMEKVDYVDLRNNPIICDCHMIWLLNNSIQKTKSMIVCSSPAWLLGRDFKSLSVTDLVCVDADVISQQANKALVIALFCLTVAGVFIFLIEQKRSRNKLEIQTLSSYSFPQC